MKRKSKSCPCDAPSPWPYGTRCNPEGWVLCPSPLLTSKVKTTQAEGWDSALWSRAVPCLSHVWDVMGNPAKIFAMSWLPPVAESLTFDMSLFSSSFFLFFLTATLGSQVLKKWKTKLFSNLFYNTLARNQTKELVGSKLPDFFFLQKLWKLTFPFRPISFGLQFVKFLGFPTIFTLVSWKPVLVVTLDINQPTTLFRIWCLYPSDVFMHGRIHL